MSDAARNPDVTDVGCPSCDYGLPTVCESSAATDREFLTDVRTRASDALTKDICALDSEADPADVHEDVREALWPFFLEIRDRFGVEGDV